MKEKLTRKNTLALDSAAFSSPRLYPEAEIDRRFIRHFGTIFRGYSRLQPSKLIAGWFPDLFGYCNENVIVGEIKGSPPACTMCNTLYQVADYGERLHARYPKLKIKLLITGPWRIKSIEHYLELFIPDPDRDKRNIVIGYLYLPILGALVIGRKLEHLEAAIDYLPFSTFEENPPTIPVLPVKKLSRMNEWRRAI